MPNGISEPISQGEIVRWLKRIEEEVTKGFGRVDNDIILIKSELVTQGNYFRDRLDQLDKVSYREWEKAREDDKIFNSETREIAVGARNMVWAMFVCVAISVISSAYAIVSSVR